MVWIAFGTASAERVLMLNDQKCHPLKPQLLNEGEHETSIQDGEGPFRYINAWAGGGNTWIISSHRIAREESKESIVKPSTILVVVARELCRF
jgi:hypothetical protein